MSLGMRCVSGFSSPEISSKLWCGIEGTSKWALKEVSGQETNLRRDGAGVSDHLSESEAG